MKSFIAAVFFGVASAASWHWHEMSREQWESDNIRSMIEPDVQHVEFAMSQDSNAFIAYGKRNNGQFYQSDTKELIFFFTQIFI